MFILSVLEFHYFEIYLFRFKYTFISFFYVIVKFTLQVLNVAAQVPLLIFRHFNKIQDFNDTFYRRKFI